MLMYDTFYYILIILLFKSQTISLSQTYLLYYTPPQLLFKLSLFSWAHNNENIKLRP
jgi:hypothetical protein